MSSTIKIPSNDNNSIIVTIDGCEVKLNCHATADDTLLDSVKDMLMESYFSTKKTLA